jgi:hypothetical protein
LVDQRQTHLDEGCHARRIRVPEQSLVDKNTLFQELIADSADRERISTGRPTEFVPYTNWRLKAWQEQRERQLIEREEVTLTSNRKAWLTGSVWNNAACCHR